MSRHPYTYSCDLLRLLGPHKGISPVLSRSDASHLREGIAEALGLGDEELATKLSDYYQKNQEALENARAKNVMPGRSPYEGCDPHGDWDMSGIGINRS